MKAGLMLGAFFLMIPSRWAAAGESAPVAVPAPGVEASTPGVQRLPAPRPTAADLLTIRGATFYDVVGRPDLASEYRSRHGWAIASRVVGGISLGIGALAWAGAQAFADPLCDSPSCRPKLLVPDLMMAGGAALLILPFLWSNDPVSDEEKARLAHEAENRWAGLSMAAAPAADGRGGTFVVGGRF
jgi:hypothetical protein